MKDVITVNKFKNLIYNINKRISTLTNKLCLSEEYGYCFDKEELNKLIQSKYLIKKYFLNFKKEIEIETTKKIVKEDKRLEIPFPKEFPSKGVWVQGVFIPIIMNSIQDIDKLKIYLENKKLFSFFAYKIDYRKQLIYSCKREILETNTDTKECNICLDNKDFKFLIEDVC